MPDVDDICDVLIYEVATGKVDAIVGESMRRGRGFYNAEKRLETALGRINDQFDACIVPTGVFKVGDTLTNEYR